MTTVNIDAKQVAVLREKTGAGMMDCRKALVESNGDIEGAVDILRKKGAASAAKKASRAANEGVIAQSILAGAKAGVIVEVNCETDFVAKNESFLALTAGWAKTLAENPATDLEPARIEAVTKVGENIQIRRMRALMWPATDWSPPTFISAEKSASCSKSARAGRTP